MDITRRNEDGEVGLVEADMVEEIREEDATEGMHGSKKRPTNTSNLKNKKFKDDVPPPPPPPPPPPTFLPEALTVSVKMEDELESGEEEEDDDDGDHPDHQEEQPGEFLVKSLISELLLEFNTATPTGSDEDETIFLRDEISKKLRQPFELPFVALEKRKVEMSSLMTHSITQMELTHGGVGTKSGTSMFRLGEMMLKKLEEASSTQGNTMSTAPVSMEATELEINV